MLLITKKVGRMSLSKVAYNGGAMSSCGLKEHTKNP